MKTTFIEFAQSGQVGRVMAGIECAISRSFEDDGARITGDEIQRRFTICERLIERLRGDLGWGLHRVLDHIPHYLRCELDGQPWEPNKRTIWVPEDGR
jgi:hypothetical protein